MFFVLIGIKGADIPDIERAVQFGVPPSLSVFAQRAGRTGRNPTIRAEATLIAEALMFQVRKASKPPAKGKGAAASKTNAASVVAEVSKSDDDVVYGKKVDPDVREWIECESCRRQTLNVYFDGPPIHSRKHFVTYPVCFVALTRRLSAPAACCCDRDNHVFAPATFAIRATVALHDSSDSCPVTLTTAEGAEPGSTHSTPTAERNSNGKRPGFRWLRQTLRRGGLKLSVRSTNSPVGAQKDFCRRKC